MERTKVAGLLFILLAGCSGTRTESGIERPLLTYQVQSTWPHDVKAFTQGLVIHGGELYESTGESDSWVGIVDIKSGKAERKAELENKYFGEGITILNNKLYQLTWKSKTGFIYQLPSFQKVAEFKYRTEGWGLTHDSERLIMSDGSAQLFFLDTVTFEIKKSISVAYSGEPVKDLNELEYINGKIYANIWKTDLIARIDPETGEVDGFIDLSQLHTQAKMLYARLDVLNGIAWHEGTGSLLVTGKNWPLIYVLKLTNGESK